MEGEASYAYAANPATRDFNIAMLEFQAITVMLNVFFESKPPPDASKWHEHGETHYHQYAVP